MVARCVIILTVSGKWAISLRPKGKNGKVFYGEYHHQLDDKGRFRIPPDFRKLLGEKPMMVLSFEKCLLLYTQNDFAERVEKRFENADILNTKMSDLKRVIFPMAQPVTEDKQGRVLLNRKFIESCGMSKNIVSIGTMDRVEIWDEEAYKKHMDSIDFDKILASFTE